MPAPCWSREDSSGDRDRGRAPTPHHLSSLPVASTGRRLRPLCSSGDRRHGRVCALLSFAHWSFKVPPTRGLPLTGALVFPRALSRILKCLPEAEEGPLEGSGPVGEPRAQSQPFLPRGGGLGPFLCCGDAGVTRAFALWPLPSGVELAVCGRTGVGFAAAQASFARCARSWPGSRFQSTPPSILEGGGPDPAPASLGTVGRAHPQGQQDPFFKLSGHFLRSETVFLVPGICLQKKGEALR